MLIYELGEGEGEGPPGPLVNIRTACLARTSAMAWMVLPMLISSARIPPHVVDSSCFKAQASHSFWYLSRVMCKSQGSSAISSNSILTWSNSASLWASIHFSFSSSQTSHINMGHLFLLPPFFFGA
ncbi:hypothetical protein NE237_001460 [Protea cynaroides]|uniref:Uncharacterized protein n=1 Tax=Protea cynaroides TaxID=273540 RepID=A0A9Q0KTI6_9MAGN|nr:hypothetical protein NE237_001460 [Protea cynaroides]